MPSARILYWTRKPSQGCLGKMSETDTAQYLLQWVRDTENGLAAYIQYYLDQGDTSTLQRIKTVYDEIKAAFGF